jgi:predicted dehydrogenase
LLLYFMGDVERVFATTGVFQKVRRRGGLSQNLRSYYGHRVEDEFAGQQEVVIDAEDTALGIVEFQSGASGQITMSDASHGHGVDVFTVHGSEGTLLFPHSRSGEGPVIKIEGRENPLVGAELLALVPDWELDDIGARLWDGQRRFTSYEMPFEQIDRKITAVELQDFAEAIEEPRSPEVDAAGGIRALALAYALLESGQAGRPVTMTEVLDGDASAYQDEINTEMGL